MNKDCDSCGHRMQFVGGVQWCPECGTVLAKGKMIMPNLVTSCRMLTAVAHSSKIINNLLWMNGIWPRIFRRPELIVPEESERTWMTEP